MEGDNIKGLGLYVVRRRGEVEVILERYPRLNRVVGVGEFIGEETVRRVLVRGAGLV